MGLSRVMGSYGCPKMISKVSFEGVSMVQLSSKVMEYNNIIKKDKKSEI